MQNLTGQSAGQFMRNYRLNLARELIIRNRLTHNMNISEIAYEVGFNDPKYFTRCFTKHFGTTPSSMMENGTDWLIPERKMNGLYTINAPFFYALVSLNKLSLPYIIIAYLIPMKNNLWLGCLPSLQCQLLLNKLQLQDPTPFKSKCIRKTRHPRLFRHL